MKRKLISAILVIALVITLAAVIPHTSAAQFRGETVYFTVIDDTLLDLDYATMPASIDGVIYMPYTVFIANFYLRASYNASEQVLIITSPSKILRFDLAEGVAYDKNSNVVRQAAKLYRGQVFIPADFVANYFGMTFYLFSDASIVRICSDMVEIPDAFLERQFSSQMDEMLRTLLDSETTSTLPPETTTQTTTTATTTTYLPPQTSKASSAQTTTATTTATTTTTTATTTTSTTTTTATTLPSHVIFSFLANDTSEIPELLDFLDKNDITACIYTDGTDPEVTAAITAAGHTLGVLLVPARKPTSRSQSADDLTSLANQVNDRFYRTIRRTSRLVWCRSVSESELADLTSSGYDMTSYVLACDSEMFIAQNVLTSGQETVNLLIPDATEKTASLVLNAVNACHAIITEP